MRTLRFVAITVVTASLLAGAAFYFREALAGLWIKHRLASTLSAVLGADVELEGVDLADGLLRARALRMSGDHLPFHRLGARDVRTSFDWQYFFQAPSGPMEIRTVALEIVRREPGEENRAGHGGESAPGKPMPSLDLEIGSLDIRDSKDAGWRLRDVAAHARSDAGGWYFSGKGGRVSLPGFPELHLERISAEHRGNAWHITDFSVNDGDGGTLAGSATLLNGEWSAKFAWKEAGMAQMLPGSVKQHFAGKSSGTATLENGILLGTASITGAEAKAVPVLLKLASLFAGENWSTVPWETFEFDFVRDRDGNISFSRLAAVSPKGLKVEGSGRLTADSLAADFQVGVESKGRPWLVAFMPVLFRSEKEGYFWTAVRVGGTPASPTEDLTTRVVAALAAAPVDGAVKAASELPGAAVEAADSVLKTLMGR